MRADSCLCHGQTNILTFFSCLCSFYISARVEHISVTRQDVLVPMTKLGASASNYRCHIEGSPRTLQGYRSCLWAAGSSPNSIYLLKLSWTNVLDQLFLCIAFSKVMSTVSVRGSFLIFSHTHRSLLVCTDILVSCGCPSVSDHSTLTVCVCVFVTLRQSELFLIQSIVYELAIWRVSCI